MNGSMETKTEDCVLLSEYWSSYMVLFFVSYLILLIAFVSEKVYWKISAASQPNVATENGKIRQVYDEWTLWCYRITHGSTPLGVALNTLYFFGGLASWLAYTTAQFLYTPDIYIFAKCANRPSIGVRIILIAVSNFFFLLMLLLKFFGAKDKLLFLLRIETISELIATTSAAVNIMTADFMSGFGFLRAIRFLQFPEVMSFLGILRSFRAFRLARPVCKMIALWFAGAGAVMTFECIGNFWEWNSDDPSVHPPGFNPLSYSNALYFTIVTMSTVGFGDITCKSLLGYIFSMLFMLVSVGMYANFISTIFEVLDERGDGSKAYRKVVGEQHIVICGNFDYKDVERLIKVFRIHDKSSHFKLKKKLIFLNSERLSLEMKTLDLKEILVEIYCGRPSNQVDLMRTKAYSAEAVVLLGHGHGITPAQDDAKILSQLMTVKNYCPHVTCIVRLNLVASVSNLQVIPNWSWTTDSYICINAIKLGLIGHNCLITGLSTLLTNLIVHVDADEDADADAAGDSNLEDWRHLYSRGAQKRVFCVPMHHNFAKMRFQQAASLLYSKADAYLIAIQSLNDFGQSVLVNPSDLVIVPNLMRAFVITDNEFDARRFISTDYCFSAEVIREGPSYIENKTVKHKLSRVESNSIELRRMSISHDQFEDHYFNLSFAEIEETTEFRGYGRRLERQVSSGSSHREQRRARGFTLSLNPVIDCEGQRNKHEETVAKREFSSAIIDGTTAETMKLRNHIVVCIVSDAQSPPLGLHTLVESIYRGSPDNFNTPIIVLGHRIFLENEWLLLHHFPTIFLHPCDRLSIASLKTVRVEKASNCIILASPKEHASSDDEAIVDKDSILCHYAVKMLQRSATNALDCTDSLKITQKMQPFTELKCQSNMKFLSDERYGRTFTDVGAASCEENFTLDGFARSEIFIASMLDSIVATAFYHPYSLALVASLAASRTQQDFRFPSAQGGDEEQSGSASISAGSKSGNCLIQRLDFRSSELSACLVDKDETITFAQLFCRALEKHRLLCLALYRKCDTSDERCSKRFVLTAPDGHLVVEKSDFVFVLRPG